MELCKPGSFELNLTANARREFIGMIHIYRPYPEGIECELTARDLPETDRSGTADYPFTDRGHAEPRPISDLIFEVLADDAPRGLLGKGDTVTRRKLRSDLHRLRCRAVVFLGHRSRADRSCSY